MPTPDEALRHAAEMALREFVGKYGSDAHFDALDTLVVDAARYRHLRGGKARTTGRPKYNSIEAIAWEGPSEGNVLKGEALDSAVDAAIAARSAKTGETR